MTDFVSPLESRRNRKRKRPHNNPFDSDIQTEDPLLHSNPHKKVKTNPPNADIDLCSTDSENNNDHKESKSSQNQRSPLKSIITDKNTQKTKKTKKKKRKKKKKKEKKNVPNTDTMNKCIICNKSLRSLSPTRQQLHINSCLDIKEREKNYSYSLKYECPICNTDLTTFDEPTRSKHMKQCLPDAQKNADDAEFEENPLKSLEEELKRKKEASKNVIVRTELKSIFERKFVCFLCDKSLNRHKLKGRCIHLKQCAKKSGKDIYSVCCLIGIDRDILDHPQKYEDKFNESYYKDEKKQNHKKKEKDKDIGIDIGDLGLFAFKKGNEQHLVSNDGIKHKKQEVEQEWNAFMDRNKKKKKIGINDYDEYIQDILKDLSETNAIIKKMEKLRQCLEIKLQRAQTLKTQHENMERSILESVSPKKDSIEDIDFKSQPIQCIDNAINCNIDSCYNQNGNTNDIPKEIFFDALIGYKADITDLMNILPARIRLLIQMLPYKTIDDLVKCQANEVYDGLIKAKEQRNEGNDVEYEMREIKNALNKFVSRYNKEKDHEMSVESMHSSQMMSIDPIQFKRSSVDRYDTDLLSSQCRNGKIKTHLWSIAQDTHKISPSQFKVSNILPNNKQNKKVSVQESPCASISGLNTTQCLLDGLMHNEEDDDEEIVEDLMPHFFNEDCSEVVHNENKDLNMSILDEEPELIFKSDHDENDEEINDYGQNTTFPIDLQLSLSFINADNNCDNQEIIHNEHSMQSNNGSLFDVDQSHHTQNNMDIITLSDSEPNVSPKKNANDMDIDDIFGNKNNKSMEDVEEFNMNTNDDNDIGFSMSPASNNVLSQVPGFGDDDLIITPILPRHRQRNKRMILPETPMHPIQMTPMIGADKEKILKALNLYFETPEAERKRLPAPVELPPDIAGRKEYIDCVHKMSVDELKGEMKKYGLKCGSKLMMRQRLEMAWDAMHPNSPMIRVLNKHISLENENENEVLIERSMTPKKKKAITKKKTRNEIEEDIIKVIAKNEDLLLRISIFNTIKFEEMDALIKGNDIKISKVNLQKFLDEQGISFVLPEDPNAVKGPRRVGKRRKRKRK